MSVHVIYYQNGVKMMRPVVSGEPLVVLCGEPLRELASSLRNGGILGRKDISVQCGNGECHPSVADEKKNFGCSNNYSYFCILNWICEIVALDNQ